MAQGAIDHNEVLEIVRPFDQLAHCLICASAAATGNDGQCAADIAGIASGYGAVYLLLVLLGEWHISSRFRATLCDPWM